MVNLFAALNCEGWLEVCGIRTLMHNKSSCIHAGFRSWDILRLLCCCLCFLSQGKSFVKKMCTIFSINWVNACLYSKIRLYDLMDQDQSLLPEWVPILAFAGVLVRGFTPHVVRNILYKLLYWDYEIVIQIVSMWQIKPMMNGQINVYWCVLLSCKLWTVQSYNCKTL